MTKAEETAVRNDGKLPEIGKQKLNEAQQALRKASAEAKLLLSKMDEKSDLSSAGQSKKKSLQEALKQVLVHLSSLQHIKLFGRMANDDDFSIAGLKNELGVSAKSLLVLAEAVEVAKTFVKK